jgi:HAD superfamily hydrolase (TIGR01509 family)
MIKALVFDFDGLILDTELSALQSWQEVYQSYKCELPLEKWALCIGSGFEAFDPYIYLEALLGRAVLREEIASQILKRSVEMIETQVALPGIEDAIKAAKRLGLKIAVASSSPRSWVVGHLMRLGLHEKFDAMKFGDEVVQKKPHPEIYLAALELLGVGADEAIALEDSPNGVRAAQRAGIFCVAIPNLVTGQLPLDHADLRLKSLADLPLEQLIALVENKQVQKSQESMA